LDLRGRKCQETGEGCIMRSSVTGKAHQIRIVRVIKLRGIRWPERVAHMREMRNIIFWLENLKGRDHLEDLGVDGG